MSPIRAFRKLLVLSICLCSLFVTAAPVRTNVRAGVRVANNYMIVVPVAINGRGPYDLLLDTGSNHTMLDQKLADELTLRRGGETTILEVRSSATSYAIYVESLSIADATVAGKDLILFVHPNLRGLPAGVRGVLGEDFLQKFDVLIDYRHLVLYLESGPGTLAETLMGEHLPVLLNGSSTQGERTFGRLIVTGQIRGFGVNFLSLQLDSGSNNLTLFRRSLGVGSDLKTFVDPSHAGSYSLTTLETRTVRSLKLGKSVINDLMVIALADHSHPDVDGLIPTSLFHSIFISHKGRFVILNPSFPKLPAETISKLDKDLVRDPS